MSNPFVTYLNRYTTVSPEHEAAFDEFVAQTDPPSGLKLKLNTKVEEYLKGVFHGRSAPSIILTGNAGDGKTYLCRQIVEGFTDEKVTDWGAEPVRIIEGEDFAVKVVKDLSEMGEESGKNLLKELDAARTSNETRPFLIAANEGRLRALLISADLSDLYKNVDAQLKNGADFGNDRLIVLNLNQITTSSYIEQLFEWLTNSAHWSDCEACPAKGSCPIRYNVDRLSNPSVVRRLKLLYRILEHLGHHVTFRDMLIHLVYTITGGTSCETIQQNSLVSGDWAPHKFAFFQNVWGEEASDSFRYKTTVLQHLTKIDVGKNSIYEVDDFIINAQFQGADATVDHQTLFAADVSLGRGLFHQDRESYINGHISLEDDSHTLLTWLKHCRRKVFFEWTEQEYADRLIPFQTFKEYFKVAENPTTGLLNQNRDLLIKGLNRAFSKLFLTKNDYLYITAQYSNTAEQPVPIIRIKLPSMNVILKVVKNVHHQKIDNDLRELELQFYPPPGVSQKHHSWKMNLLMFEYLIRRAEGSTPDLLEAECGLAIRRLKDELISLFTHDETEGEELFFFAVERNQYQEQQLKINRRRLNSIN